MHRIEAVHCLYFVRFNIFRRVALLYMSVPDFMRKSHNLNNLSLIVQNLQKVCAWFIVVKNYEFIGH